MVILKVAALQKEGQLNYINALTINYINALTINALTINYINALTTRKFKKCS
jgi:hypothetical protein